MSKNKILIEGTHPPFQKTDSYLLYGFSYRFRLWVYRFFNFEEFANKQVLLDEFDSIHLKFVFMGFHDMEEHFKLKEIYFSKIKHLS